MARILYTGIVSEITGSVAGTTFQRNASGKIVKSRSNQKFASSTEQSFTQALFANTVTKWRSLSAFDRESWTEIANDNPRYDKWGRLKMLSGFQYHAACNRNLATIGESYQASPTPYVAPLVPTPVAIDVDADSFNIDFGLAINYTGYKVLIFASPPTQQFSYKSRPKKRLITQLSGSYLDSVNILPNYIEVYPINWASFFSNATALIQLFLSTVNISTGLSSTFFTIYQAFPPP